MIAIIAKNEIVSAFRNKTAVLLTVIFYLLTTVAFIGGWKNFSTGDSERKQAKDMFRQEWVIDYFGSKEETKLLQTYLL